MPANSKPSPSFLSARFRKPNVSIAARLRSVYGFQVDIAPTTPLPKSAYYPPRARYRADRLLTWLGPRFRTDHILGITTHDISTTKGEVADWGVFGLGEMPGRTTVISSFRLRKPGKITVSERLRESQSTKSATTSDFPTAQSVHHVGRGRQHQECRLHWGVL